MLPRLRVATGRATVRTVTSRQNALVTRFRIAARAGRRSRTHVLLDGLRLVSDARRSGVAIDTLVVSGPALRRGDAALATLAADCEAAGVEVAAASESVMAAVSPLRSPSTAVALAACRPASVDAVLSRAARGCIIAPAGVQDPGNLGAIIRASDAAGAGGVAVCASSADPFGWKALRGAMGSTFRLPVADAGDGQDLPARAAHAGCAVLAATPRGGRSLYELDLRRPLLVLIGSEGSGIGSALAEAAGGTVSIPMTGGVDSLNAAVAAALIAYEAHRQRSAA